MKIVGSYVSPYVRKVLACMALKGIDDYEIDPITPFFGGEDFTRLSPLRRIPVLIHGDLVLTDSSVICAWLDEAFPGHPLLPASPDDRARARWLEEYADTRLGDLCIWSLFYQRIVGPMVFGDATDDARVERTLSEGLPQALDYLESEAPAEGFRFGAIGLADIAVASFFRNAAYAKFAIDPGRWPKAAAWIARTLAHDCLDRFLKFEQAQLGTNPQGRRQALLDAGAPLASESYGVRQPTRGVMSL